MSNSGRVYFGLRGNFTPAELTEAIGIQPTSAKMKGERVAGKLPACSLWAYSSEETEGEIVDVYALSSKVVRALEPYADRIATEVQKRDLSAVLQVVLWISTDDEISTPVIGFETEVIAFLHQVGGTIDIDTYRNTPEDSDQL
ncbi:DUF4279 domain-containing protein [Thermodesulfobacteriota bacterium]